MESLFNFNLYSHYNRHPSKSDTSVRTDAQRPDRAIYTQCNNAHLLILGKRLFRHNEQFLNYFSIRYMIMNFAELCITIVMHVLLSCITIMYYLLPSLLFEILYCFQKLLLKMIALLLFSYD